jgi:hypothetical protein
MTFVQIIDYETANPDQVEGLFDEWIKATEGKRTASHELHMQDRENTSHFVDVVEFPSYEKAMENNDLPETQKIAEQMRSLCSRAPTFINLEVRRDAPL